MIPLPTNVNKYSKKRREACEGKRCLKCNTTKGIKCVGACPDLTQMNYRYDCTKCGNEWEGF